MVPNDLTRYWGLFGGYLATEIRISNQGSGNGNDEG